MYSFIFVFYKSFLKKNILFYIICIVFLINLYYQTFGLEFDIANKFEVSNLWGVKGNGVSDYLDHIGVQYFVLLLIGTILFVNLTSSFFSSEYLAFILPKTSNRNKVLISYTMFLALFVYSIFFIHIVALNIILYIKLRSTFFISSFWVLLYVIPVCLYISVTVTFFSLLVQNRINNVSMVFIYLVVIPFLMVVFYQNGVEIPFLPNFFVEYSELYAPFFLSYISGIFDYSFAFDLFPTLIGLVIGGTILALSSTYIFSKKVI